MLVNIRWPMQKIDVEDSLCFSAKLLWGLACVAFKGWGGQSVKWEVLVKILLPCSSVQDYR